MSDTTTDPFREEARSLTGMRIDGENIRPLEVAVTSGTEIFDGSQSRFEIEISKVVLHHELQEARIVIEWDELEEFVQNDLTNHPQESLSGYLGIVSGILSEEPPRRGWRLFGKIVKPLIPVKWTLVRVDKVTGVGNQILIQGLAKKVQ